MKNIFQIAILTTLVLVGTHSFAATITGKVIYDGEKPSLKEIKMDADPVCTSHNMAPVLPQSIVLGANNEIGNIFVHVKSGLAKKDYPAPAEAVVIDQKGCMYHPHVVGVMVNQTVKILNPDGTLHNVHALPKTNAEFNLAMPKFRTEVEKTFDKPELFFPVKCDVHPWMSAWVSVMTHPYFDVTGEDGTFEIKDLPAGEYEIEAWQEKLGTQTAKITVVEGADQEVNFTFSKPAKN